MKKYITQYITAFIISLIADGVWLGVISKGLYVHYIGYLLSPDPNLWVALLFYVVFALAVTVFVVNPALAGKWGMAKVSKLGALLGLVIYGGYDFTNQAIIRDWPAVITFADLAWGIIMATIVSTATYSICKKLTK